jgi:ABC-2 type transport system ATP-binding protein
LATNVVSVEHLSKSYTGTQAVQDLSFSVSGGELFGLIGPNGAGKTTAIRMMMDIIQPDAGRVLILGEPSSEATKAKLGYLPEERGLYRKLTVIETIAYLASLKGMDARSIKSRADALLDQTGMLAHKKKRVEELSKGMAQIIQLIVTVIHDPQLVILDEPFSGLDPVNTERVKDLLVDLRDQGKAVILSTHQMNQVEAVCDRILMIHNGRNVLYGPLEEVRAKYRGHSVLVETDDEIGKVPGVAASRPQRDHVELVLDPAATPQQILEELVRAGTTIRRFEVATPSLNEIFLQVVGGDHE